MVVWDAIDYFYDTFVCRLPIFHVNFFNPDPMKLAFQTLLAIFSFTASLSAQDFSQTDTYARSFKKSNFNSPEALSKAIVKEQHTDVEKYRALYTWIAHNIQYDRAKAKNMAHSVRFSGTRLFFVLF